MSISNCLQQSLNLLKQMQAEKPIKKPILSSGSSNKISDSMGEKISKIEAFYRYRLPSVYRELKAPIYDNLKTEPLHETKVRQDTKPQQKLNPAESIQILYKKTMLNSKYHHREKMRFSRTPLLKYLKYDFKSLEEKLKLKSFLQIYDDLQDQDEQDQSKDQKKEYQIDPHFSAEALLRYKKKNGISTRIVSAHGYDDIKQTLISKYGWVENEDVKSLMYDYKHMSKKKDIDYVNILDDQVVNHFHENKAVTAKFGLTRNIRNICSLNKDPAQFFPRCFDVNDVSELENFYQNFKETYAQSIVKKCVSNKGRVPQALGLGAYEKILDTCISIIERQLYSIEKKLSFILKQANIYISQQQWKQIQEIADLKTDYLAETVSANLLERAADVCKRGEKTDPQWNINRDNIWIVKPASLSRGRGIKTFNNINQIFDYIIGKEISWVVQKYIENPLIVKKRKFDIRQWVLLTDFRPFRVWIYEECYVRFCATIYEPENLKDRKIHLTNNSVTKGVSDITGDGIGENMLSDKQFGQLLKAKEDGKDIMRSVIRPQMQKIAVETLESVKENMQARKNTFQIFGFDFMVDENYKVWLIQVNSSPTMEYSTKVTTSIVQKGMSDLADLVNNYMFKGKFYDRNKARELYGGWTLLTNQ